MVALRMGYPAELFSPPLKKAYDEMRSVRMQSVSSRSPPSTKDLAALGGSGKPLQLTDASGADDLVCAPPRLQLSDVRATSVPTHDVDGAEESVFVVLPKMSLPKSFARPPGGKRMKLSPPSPNVIRSLFPDDEGETAREASEATGFRALADDSAALGVVLGLFAHELEEIDGFMGAVPEGQLKSFLNKHLPSLEDMAAQENAEDAQALLAAGDPQAALNKLHETLTIDPGNDDARFDYVKLLIETNALDDAAAALAPALAAIPRQLRFEALGQFLDAINFVMSDPRGTWGPDQFDALIAANKRDFDTRLAKARVLMVGGMWTESMDELLEIIMRDKTWNDAVARKTFVAILELLTPPKPKAGNDTGKAAGGIELLGKAVVNEDPQAQLVSAYRRKLSMALN